MFQQPVVFLKSHQQSLRKRNRTQTSGTWTPPHFQSRGSCVQHNIYKWKSYEKLIYQQHISGSFETCIYQQITSKKTSPPSKPLLSQVRPRRDTRSFFRANQVALKVCRRALLGFAASWVFNGMGTKNLGDVRFFSYICFQQNVHIFFWKCLCDKNLHLHVFLAYYGFGMFRDLEAWLGVVWCTAHLFHTNFLGTITSPFPVWHIRKWMNFPLSHLVWYYLASWRACFLNISP